MLQYIFNRILVMSLCGALLTLALLALKPFTKRYFSAKWHYVTYSVCLLVLLLPLSVKVRTETVSGLAYAVYPVSQTDGIIPAAAQKAPDCSGLVNGCVTVYFVLAFAVFMFYVTSYFVFLSRIKNAEKADLSDMPNNLPVHFYNVSSPMLVGVLKPKALLPEREYTKEDLQNIFAHELTHLKRRDIVIKWLCVLVKSLHFFNPLIYVLCKQIDEWCEISCDIQAIQSFDEQQIRSYCNTILSLAIRKNNSAALTLGAGSTKQSLERRFTAIMENKPRKKKVIISAVILAAILTLSALTASALLAGKQQKPITTDNPKLIASNKDGISTPTEPSEPQQSPVTYNTNASQNGEEPNLLPTVYVEPIVGDEVSIIADYKEGFHNGIDYKAAKGTPVVAAISGTVTTAEYSSEKGNHIIIQGENQNESTLFAHLENMTVKVGDKVEAGDKIGTVGSTGMSTGPHLHFEYHVAE